MNDPQSQRSDCASAYRSAAPPDGWLFNRQFQALYWSERATFANDDPVLYFVVLIAGHGPHWLLARSARDCVSRNVSSVASSPWRDVLFISCAFVVQRTGGADGIDDRTTQPLPLDTPLEKLIIYRRIPLLVPSAQEPHHRLYRSMLEQMICHVDPLIDDIWLVERHAASGHLVMAQRPVASRIPTSGLLRDKTLAERARLIDDEVSDPLWAAALRSVCVPYQFAENNGHILPMLEDDRRSVSSGYCVASASFLDIAGGGGGGGGELVASSSSSSSSASPEDFACDSAVNRDVLITIRTQSGKSVFTIKVSGVFRVNNSRVLWPMLDTQANVVTFTVPDWYQATTIALAIRFACANFSGGEDELASMEHGQLIAMFKFCEVYLRLDVWPRRMAVQCLLCDRALLRTGASLLADLLNLIPRGESPSLEQMAALMGIEPGNAQYFALPDVAAHLPSYEDQAGHALRLLRERYVSLLRALEENETSIACQTVQEAAKSTPSSSSGARKRRSDAAPKSNQILSWPPRIPGESNPRLHRRQVYMAQIEFCRKQIIESAGQAAVNHVDERILDERIRRLRSVVDRGAGDEHNKARHFGGLMDNNETVQLITASQLLERLVKDRAGLATAL